MWSNPPKNCPQPEARTSLVLGSCTTVSEDSVQSSLKGSRPEVLPTPHSSMLRPPAIAQPEHPGLSSSPCRRGGTDGPATLLQSPPPSYPYQPSSSCSESTWQGQGRSLWSPVRTRPSQSSSNTFHTGGLRRVLWCFPPFSSMTSRRGSPLAAESSAPDWAPRLGIQIWASLSCCPGLGVPVWVWGARGACGVGGSLPAQPPSLLATAEGPAASGEPPFRNPARTLEASRPPQACVLSSFLPCLRS